MKIKIKTELILLIINHKTKVTKVVKMKFKKKIKR